MNKRIIFLHILSVYLLSVMIRLIFAWQVSDSSLHILDGEYISILSNDTSLYGYYAKLLLEGLPHHTNVYSIEYLLYYLVLFTPFSLDEIIFFSPAFLSSLIVIPAMLLSALYIHSKTIITLIGILSGIGYGYYSRTYLGYFDTDLLNIFFPMLMLYGMVASFKKENYYYLIITLFSTLSYASWYHASMILIYALYAIFLFYTLLHYYQRISFSKKNLYLIFGFLALSIIFLFSINFQLFIHHAQRYIFTPSLFEVESFKFVSPLAYISEAKGGSIEFISHLISGNIYLFLMSLIGYSLLVYKHREMIITLPLLVLGILSFYSGMRFHIYATTLLIISYFFLVYTLIEYWKPKYKIKFIIIFIFSLSPLYENYDIVYYWNTKGAKPLFYSEQIKALKKLEKLSSPKDYAISWWDYGQPISYYTKLQTMINNTIHHSDNYTVASILLSNNPKFTHHASHYFCDTYDLYKHSAISQGLKQHHTPTKLFDYIENKYDDINNSRNKYIILPSQIKELIYTIYLFANIAPLSGKKIGNHIFRTFNKSDEDKKFIYFKDGSKIHKQQSKLLTDDREFNIQKISLLRHLKKDKEILHQKISTQGLYLIIEDNQYYIMDAYFYHSTLIQMLFFNAYNKKYFSPVYEGKSISIYKVK